jgi:hypothetical protein
MWGVSSTWLKVLFFFSARWKDFSKSLQGGGVPVLTWFPCVHSHSCLFIYIKEWGSYVSLSTSCWTGVSRSLKVKRYWQGLFALGDCSGPVGGTELSWSVYEYCHEKSLKALGNKARKGLIRARSDSQQNEEKIRGPIREFTHGIHLAQEDHCPQMSTVCCWRLAAHS